MSPAAVLAGNTPNIMRQQGEQDFLAQGKSNEEERKKKISRVLRKV